jgi:hypothetical protein
VEWRSLAMPLRPGQRHSPVSFGTATAALLIVAHAQMRKINYVNKAACEDCPIRSRCTRNDFRAVSRLENEAVLDRMAIKQWMDQGAFLMRRLRKVRAEFSLTALAYNLRRVLNIVEFTTLMAAVQG